MPFTEIQMDDAYVWLCQRRRRFPPNADVWHLRFNWAREKVHLCELLQKRRYQFSPLQVVQKADGEIIHLWSVRDALVLKALTSLLAGVLPISPACTHVKGNGGLKATVRRVHEQHPNYRYVLRTDVKGYYESIDHFLLIEQLAKYVKDKFILNLLWQYLHRMVERGGLYREIQQGISRGCPSSPLIGAFFLTELDTRCQQDGLFYVRHMDDVLILAPTRWKLRRAVKTLNEIFNTLKLEKHPDKTFIGRIEKGFDFLGYHFSREGLSVAEDTVKRFIAKATRLYEQERENPKGFSQLGLYVRRWVRWTEGGLGPHKKNPASAGIFIYYQRGISATAFSPGERSSRHRLGKRVGTNGRRRGAVFL